MTLHLAVQYGSDRAAPLRAQVRRWVVATLDAFRAAARDTVPIDAVSLTIRFVDEPEGRALNRQFRGGDYATNVLTFGYDDAPDGAVVADIVVCLPVVEAEARAQRKAVAEHCGHLVVHGTLHACGLDHESPVEADTMEALERTVLARFRIVDPYAMEH